MLSPYSPLESLFAFGLCFALGAVSAIGLDRYVRKLKQGKVDTSPATITLLSA